MGIPCVGKCFATAAEFMAYLDGLQFGAWRPRFVTMHHTGGPNLATWRGWQGRTKPITDEQWMKNLAAYYGNEMRWSAGPHFFFTPAHFCVLSPPTARGVHAVSFNAVSWGVECVGDFDSEPFDGAVRDKYVEGLACLHIATGLQLDPFQRGVRGLHFHRDDPKTKKTCPGHKVERAALIKLVAAKIAELTGGEHPSDPENHAAAKPERTGTVKVDGLNVRASASSKAPIIRQLTKGTRITITGEASNGDTTWLAVAGIGGFVSAAYVDLN